MSLKHMKSLIVLVVGLLVAGCGETEEPVKEELTVEEKKALRDSVVGEYESKYENGDTFKHVYLENGVYEFYSNGKKQVELKWSIIDGEIHVEYSSGGIDIYRINPDKSITRIATILRGTPQMNLSKENQSTLKKLK